MTSRTTAAESAQKRRDHETQAREALGRRLESAKAFRSEYSARGEFNLTTKTLIATLLFLDPDATVKDVSKLNASTLEYNQQRRDNERSIRGQLEAILSTNFSKPEVMSQSYFNRSTMVMLAADECMRDKLRAQGNANPTDSNLSDLHEIFLPKHPSAIDREKTVDRKDYGHARNPQTTASEFKQVTPFQEHMVTNESVQPTISSAQFEGIRRTTSRLQRTSELVMSPSTRSSSNTKTPASLLQPDVFPTYPPLPPSSDDTVSDSSLSDEPDMFVNLRVDELDQEMYLDAKPPTLPKRAFQNQGHWEIKARDMSSAPHSSIYVRELEQAANRLIAKAKELVIAHDGDDKACQKSLIEAQEWCVDTIDMISGEIDRKKYRRKWSKRRHEWEASNMHALRSSE